VIQAQGLHYKDRGMKHQYFADVNDYRKYGLLRGLSGQGSIQTGICWMLTGPDGRSDGDMLAYLAKVEEFRPFAPDLFDFLRECVHLKKDRRIHCIEAAGLLPATIYHSEFLSDDHHARSVYFQQMFQRFANVNLLFFDPDNGLETKSTPLGRKGSSKYLYWTELEQAYNAGHSVLVYQHFIREKRNTFIQRLIFTIMNRTAANVVVVFRTPRVVFFLIPQPGHEDHFCRQSDHISLTWNGQIDVHTVSVHNPILNCT
jgi:hypothetical protein